MKVKGKGREGREGKEGRKGREGRKERREGEGRKGGEERKSKKKMRERKDVSKQPLSQGMTAFPVCATKTLAVDRERGYNNFVHIVSNTIDNELNQKPSKRRRSIPEDDTRRAQYGVLT